MQRALYHCRGERKRPRVLRFKLSSGSRRCRGAGSGPVLSAVRQHPGMLRTPPDGDLSEMLTQALILTPPSSTN